MCVWGLEHATRFYKASTSGHSFSEILRDSTADLLRRYHRGRSVVRVYSLRYAGRTDGSSTFGLRDFDEGTSEVGYSSSAASDLVRRFNRHSQDITQPLS